PGGGSGPGALLRDALDSAGGDRRWPARSAVHRRGARSERHLRLHGLDPRLPREPGRRALMFVFFAALYEAPEGPPPGEEQVQRWVRAARLGNAAAAGRLYDACAHRVYRSVRPTCVSDADAEDATQDAFVDALTHLQRYTPREGVRFVGWVATL